MTFQLTLKNIYIALYIFENCKVVNLHPKGLQENFQTFQWWLLILNSQYNYSTTTRNVLWKRCCIKIGIVSLAQGWYNKARGSCSHSVPETLAERVRCDNQRHYLIIECLLTNRMLVFFRLYQICIASRLSFVLKCYLLIFLGQKINILLFRSIC